MEKALVEERLVCASQARRAANASVCPPTTALVLTVERAEYQWPAAQNPNALEHGTAILTMGRGKAWRGVTSDDGPWRRE